MKVSVTCHEVANFQQLIQLSRYEKLNDKIFVMHGRPLQKVERPGTSWRRHICCLRIVLYTVSQKNVPSLTGYTIFGTS